MGEKQIRRPTLWSTILLAFVLALSAGFAAPAQAFEWASDGTTFEGLKLEKESLGGVASGSFKFEVAKLKYILKCESAAVSGSLTKGGTGTMNIELTKCIVTDLEGKELKNCVVKTTPVLKAKVEQVEVKGVVYAKLTPAAENPSAKSSSANSAR